jgi:phenylalanyl-tRNA synthetase alpha chain
MPGTIGEVREAARGLRAEFDAALAVAGDAPALQGLRDRFLGRKSGAVTALLKSLGRLPEADRREAGQELNALKAAIEQGLDDVGSTIAGRRREDALHRDRLDGTLPGRRPYVGRLHPLTVVRHELEDIFVAMGYEVYDGPEVEDDYHCFEALNMPPDHPARDMQDTFYLEGPGGLLLRTHTSSAQIHYMLENEHPPEVRIICPGKVFRRDSDVTHSPMFQQIEGLVVGEGITMGDLKGTLVAVIREMFAADARVMFRPSFFPYTEPSADVFMGCAACDGSGCAMCKRTGWIEVLGCGMVHPAVFEAVGYDPERYTGFAFGIGIERIAILKHAVDDIRLFYDNDLRFLEQFRD